MDANFFYYSIYDRFIQRQPCTCMHAFVNFFFKKLLQISQECSLAKGILEQDVRYSTL